MRQGAELWKIGNRRLLVIGDRVLIKQENLEERTEVGLYLPQTVIGEGGGSGWTGRG